MKSTSISKWISMVLCATLLATLGITILPTQAVPVRAAPNCAVAIYGSPAVLAYQTDIQDKLVGTGLFSQVDSYFVKSDTDPNPTLAQLQQYKAVLVYSDWLFHDNVGLGNVLADYMDAGGGVVMATFAWHPWWGNIAGRIVTAGYLPYAPGDDRTGSATMSIDLPTDPILTGVTSFSGGTSSYRNIVSLTLGSTLVAHWSDGLPLIATKQPTAGKIVGLNFFPPSSTARADFWDANTDGDLIMANSLAWAGGCALTSSDTTPPTLTIPGNMTVEATSASGAIVTFSATASDDTDPAPVVTCTPASGTQFPLGTTQVTCSAQDVSGNTSALQSFNVTVVDTTPPDLTVPADMVVTATTSQGAVVTYTTSATDLVDASPTITCVPPSGSTFPIGTTTVNCSAIDDYGNSASASFQVAVTEGNQLLQNPGFDQPITTNKIWVFSVLTKPISSLVDCTLFISPNCSLKMVAERLTRYSSQTVMRSGRAGDQYSFGLSSKAINIPATGAFKVEILVYNSLGNPVLKQALNFSNGTHDFEMVNGVVTMPAAYAKIIFRIVMQKDVGVAWFDDAFLIALP